MIENRMQPYAAILDLSGMNRWDRLAGQLESQHDIRPRVVLSLRQLQRRARLEYFDVVVLPIVGHGPVTARHIVDCGQSLAGSPPLIALTGADDPDSTLLVEESGLCGCFDLEAGAGSIAAEIRRILTGRSRLSHGLPRPEMLRLLRHSQQTVTRTIGESLRALVAAANAKEPSAATHSLGVAYFAEDMARRLQLPSHALVSIRRAALLHDVGKIAMPDAILQKAGPLTPGEFEIVKQHPAAGLSIIRHIRRLEAEQPLILHHHERYDGRGYPHGLRGEDIPIGARILAAADAVDTMLARRAYKEPFTIQRVRRELRKGASRQFDPRVAQVAEEMLDGPLLRTA